MIEFLVGFVIGLIVGIAVCIIYYMILKDDEPKRTGTIYRQFTGDGLLNKNRQYDVKYTVQELKRVGDLSYIRVIDVSGAGYASEKQQFIDMLGEYVETNKIKWEDEKSEVAYIDEQNKTKT